MSNKDERHSDLRSPAPLNEIGVALSSRANDLTESFRTNFIRLVIYEAKLARSIWSKTMSNL